MEIRDLIKESTVRAGVVPRRQAPPGEVQETALKLLKGIVSKFSNDNLLSFTQIQLDLPSKKKIHIYDTEDTLGGEFNRYFKTTSQLLDSDNYPDEEDFNNGVWAIAYDDPTKVYDVQHVAQNTYRFIQMSDVDEYEPRVQQMRNYVSCYHMMVKDVAKLNTFMLKNATEQYIKINFIPRDEFDSFDRSAPCWTFAQRAEGEWVIETKPVVADCARAFRLSYNRALHIDIDTDLRVPDAYVELLIVALTVELCKKYPRLDDAHIQRLKEDLAVMIDNVRAPKAENKMILRDAGYGITKYSTMDILSGRCLL